MEITFLGGVGTVTGSKYLVDHDGCRFLVDCGLFQGYKPLRLRNWRPLPIDPSSIDAVILTHAHLDHSGYLPRLVKNGFKGPIHATSATCDLCEILLRDSGYLQERDAAFANRHGFSKHRPAEPLYTEADAKVALQQFRGVQFGDTVALSEALSATFVPAGHILGASCVTLDGSGTKLVFSGDLGRRGMATTVDPTEGLEADYLVVESTYGNRRHGDEDPASILATVIIETIARGGTVLIPAFAVGRSQSLLYYIEQLKREARIPDVPVYLDSPMAINASDIFCAHLDAHRLTPAQCSAMCGVATYVKEVEDSKAIDHDDTPKIIISASGMATGGRILHHLKRYAPDPRTTILFAGFQAGGTRGAAMVAGAEQVKIHGGWVPVRAEVKTMDMLSAHADADGIMEWLRTFPRAPRHTFITHGEPEGSEALRVRIKEELGWVCSVPEQAEHVPL